MGTVRISFERSKDFRPVVPAPCDLCDGTGVLIGCNFNGDDCLTTEPCPLCDDRVNFDDLFPWADQAEADFGPDDTGY